MARPRTVLDEPAVVKGYRAGQSISELARTFEVDRYVIRRIVTAASEAKILNFPGTYAPPIPEGSLTAVQLADTVGISHVKVDHWTKAKLLRPNRAADGRTGAPRYYPTSEVEVARLLDRLNKVGLAARIAHDLARDLIEHGHAELAGFRIELPEGL